MRIFLVARKSRKSKLNARSYLWMKAFDKLRGGHRQLRSILPLQQSERMAVMLRVDPLAKG